LSLPEPVKGTILAPKPRESGECRLRQVGWFEVVETRGHVEDGKVAHYQVNLKIGFTLEDDD
jgi:flavin-binding protein dodecin